MLNHAAWPCIPANTEESQLQCNISLWLKCRTHNVNVYRLSSKSGAHKLPIPHSAGYLQQICQHFQWSSSCKHTGSHSANKIWKYSEWCSSCLLLIPKWMLALKILWRPILTVVFQSLEMWLQHSNPFGLNAPIQTSYRSIKNWMGINNSSSLELELVLQWSLQFININTWVVLQATNYYLLLRGTYGELYRYRYCFLPNMLPLEVFQSNNLLIHSATKLFDIQRGYARTSERWC